LAFLINFREIACVKKPRLSTGSFIRIRARE
jgi:hypothetical protein